MAIAGNSPRKSKATHKDKDTYDAGGNHGMNNDTEEDDQEQNNKFIKVHSQTSLSETRKDNGEGSLELLEDEIVCAEESLQKFLVLTIGKSNSKVYDILSKHGQKLTIRPNGSILKKDETGSGIFILLAGKVHVLTSDGSEIMKTLNAGDVFGEVATLFDIPVTANITAASDVTLVKLPKQVTLELFQGCNQGFDLIDWFIQRQYLPTGSAVDSSRVYRRLALSTFKHIPVLRTWSEEMIKKLILSFDRNIVTLYPKGSIIVLEKDPLASLYIVVTGEIEIKQDSKTISNISVTAGEDPFVYTELALLVDGKISPVTIKTLTNCQIVQLNNEWVIKILECYPEQMESFSEEARLFRASFKRLGHIYLKNEAYLQIEILASYLKQSHIYASSTMQQLWRLILSGDLQEFEAGTSVVLEVEREKYESIVVVRGEVIQLHGRDSTERDAITEAVDDDEAGQQTDIGQSCDKAGMNTGEGMDTGENDLDQDVDSDIQVLGAGAVVDMETVTEKPMSLKAKTPCLILKIRKCKTGDNTNAQTEEVTADNGMSRDALNMV